jgi:hypothetical protein
MLLRQRTMGQGMERALKGFDLKKFKDWAFTGLCRCNSPALYDNLQASIEIMLL